ncbi:hypothetical protein [Arthrobacter sp. B0490]|nr:hypothetical protein [Arthrobacter sp. B0490]
MLDSQQVREIRDSVGRVLADIGVLLPAWFNSQETISSILAKHPTHPIP